MDTWGVKLVATCSAKLRINCYSTCSAKLHTSESPVLAKVSESAADKSSNNREKKMSEEVFDAIEVLRNYVGCDNDASDALDTVVQAIEAAS